jgi:hypothetical protein
VLEKKVLGLLTGEAAGLLTDEGLEGLLTDDG